MITKAIVEKIYDNYRIAVRIPIFDKVPNVDGATPTDQLGVATICTLPKASPNIMVGDTVFVAFENNDISQPVIIGYLYSENLPKAAQGLNLDSIEVSAVAKLPSQTTIGDVSMAELQCLKGTKSNLQTQLNYILEELDKLRGQINP